MHWQGDVKPFLHRLFFSSPLLDTFFHIPPLLKEKTTKLSEINLPSSFNLSYARKYYMYRSRGYNHQNNLQKIGKGDRKNCLEWIKRAKALPCPARWRTRVRRVARFIHSKKA